MSFCSMLTRCSTWFLRTFSHDSFTRGGSMSKPFARQPYFFAAVTTIVIREVFLKMERVNAEAICAAINAYLLIGLTFAFAYMVIDVLVPGSFDHEQILMGDANESFESFVYFSYVTLTTLGFGDITPRSLEAGAFVYTEAMLGQLYLAVLVARLVGMYRADEPE